MLKNEKEICMKKSIINSLPKQKIKEIKNEIEKQKNPEVRKLMNTMLLMTFEELENLKNYIEKKYK